MYPTSLDYDDITARRRKNIRRATLGLIGITVLLLTAWIYFKELDPGTPLLDNVAVFALVNLNIILLMLLVLLVVRNLVRLYHSSRKGPGGLRLQVKLVAAFVGFTLVPSVALFVVASGLINQSFNTFFNMKVEGALKGSFQVAQTFYRDAEKDTLISAKRLAKSIEGNGWGGLDKPEVLKVYIKSVREDLRADAIQLFNLDKKSLVYVIREKLPSATTFSPEQAYIEKVLQGETRSSVENWGEGDAIHGVSPVKSGSKVTGFVVVSRYIPERLVAKVKGIINAYEDYKEIELSKNPLKATYIITFLLITLLILFAATWFGFYLARGITVAIEKLAEATRAVSEGDLDHRVDVQADGEVGILVDAFNNMTQQLKANKKEIEEASLDLQRSSAEIDRRRRYMEAMLENIGTGVVSVNRRGRVTILNEAASELLGIRPEDALDRPFNDVFRAQHLEPVRRLLSAMREAGRKSVTEQVDILIDGRLLTLRASLALLQGADGNHLGAVVVFDDMSALIRAQKVAAWREVAQGIAHEIKNPLTPIQLSTQRMRRKFEQDAVDFPEVFEIATDTIIQQVEGLMELVNEFSRFARLPEPRLRICQLNSLLDQVANLYRGRSGGVSVHKEIHEDLPPVMADPDQIQRVMINLLENAFDSMENGGAVRLRALADPEKSQLIIEVADEGKGIPEENKGHVFSPYFSTKYQGSGLGLAICHRIIDDHNGTITLKDNQPRGSVFRIVFPLASSASLSAGAERTATIG
jgi:two-component system nitrogen regulation sensor histidine kinase NtrY